MKYLGYSTHAMQGLIRAIRENPHRFFRILGLCSLALFAVAHSGVYADAIIDDAFITFRHALNILRGEGYTCNPGERIEGTSSLLLTFISVIPIALGIDPLQFSKGLGRLAFAGCTVVTYLSVRTCLAGRISYYLGFGAAIMIASSSALAFHSQTGLETLVYAFLIALSFLLFLRRFVTGASSGSAWALVMGIASITRPEGVGFFIVLLGIGTVATRHTDRSRKDIRRDLVTFGAIFGIVSLFRILYFGAWVPNSVLAKSGTSLSFRDVTVGRVLQALGYGGSIAYRGYLKTQALCIVLTALTLSFKPTRLAGIAIFGITIGAISVVMWNGGGADWMPYHRLMTPAAVPLAVGMALGIRSIFFHREQEGKPSALFAALVITAGIYFVSRPLKVEVSSVLYPQVKEIAGKLEALKQEGDVVASDMGGILPYYWGIRVIDTMGLCDSYLARHGKLVAGIGRRELTYVANQRPTFFAFTYPIGAASLFTDPKFSPYRKEYYLLKWPWQYYGKRLNPITVLVRKDRPNVDTFASSLGATLIDPEDELRRTGFLSALIDHDHKRK